MNVLNSSKSAFKTPSVLLAGVMGAAVPAFGGSPVTGAIVGAVAFAAAQFAFATFAGRKADREVQPVYKIDAQVRRRNVAIALALGAMVLAFYAATFVNMGKPIASGVLKQSQQSRPQ